MKYITALSDYLGIASDYIVPLIVITLFLLTIVFSALLLRTIVNTLLSQQEKKGEK